MPELTSSYPASPTEANDKSHRPLWPGFSTDRCPSDFGKGRPSCDGMRAWLNQIGHSDAIIDEMRVIHVAGSKGKGSTCAFAEALLGAHRGRTGFPYKYGLYTSPSLHEETERIRVNSTQISEQQFAENIFEVWGKLGPSDREAESLPKFLQLLLLVCIHTFIKEGVRVAIVETHHGGQYDSTNIFNRPAATGITSLGFDHVAQLGPTIGDIAWHKAGIFKQGTPAFALGEQPEAARSVLISRADDVKTKLRFVGNDPQLPADHHMIRQKVQRLNCSLAKALVCSYLEEDAPADMRDLTDLDIRMALDHVYLPGRFQQLNTGQVQWFLDSAHNEMSIGEPVAWFAQEMTGLSVTRFEADKSTVAHKRSHFILVFSHISSERDGREVLKALIESVSRNKLKFDHVVFCYDGMREDGSLKLDQNFGTPSVQTHYEEIWQTSPLRGQIINTSTIHETISMVENLSSRYGRVNALATGSLHLVGGILAHGRSEALCGT
ncbi:MAG: hypothetical protein M1828_003098 [Chrysothrix sp. TS-e1954]|nr:MAG: hypothetical protein M1828_003098 [Chrysothrix sp. TS-e1954]